jgi:hypothetical protein
MQTEEELIIIYSGYGRKTFVYKTGHSVSVAEADLNEADQKDWTKAVGLMNGIAHRHDDGAA